MLLTEYNEAEVLEIAQENAHKEGHAEGRAEGRAEGLSEGTILACKSLGATFAQTVSMVASRLGVDEAKANEIVHKYWK